MDNLQLLYDKMKTMKTSTRQKAIASTMRTKFLTHHNLIENMFTRSVNLGVSIKQLQQAFMLCKMTVENENEDGPRDYNIIKFVEFLEFIGRVAYLRFQDDESMVQKALSVKILWVLRAIFPMIGETPINPEEEDNLQSDSDDDY